MITVDMDTVNMSSVAALAFGTPYGVIGVEQGKLQSTVPGKPLLVPTSFLSQWRAKACNIEQEQIKRATKYLEARYCCN
ncbi:hypothetical protein DSO57_1015966 [Entomophthora muscae]|uniref:Uncharacterized protein n=1 Tax=Entomophthora muscae TaxID=34485 RepID=A0ACC2T502_9FUNG|nr:hypothetical protein DSO57_1015966 [Entomophthora muscae]